MAPENNTFERYKENRDILIRDTLEKYECQPIFFIGSGFSKRYLNTPSWLDLLKLASHTIHGSHDHFNYISQKTDKDPIAIADALVEQTFEWAWKNRSEIFPNAFFEGSVAKVSYFKYLICDIINQSKLDNIPNEYNAEIKQFKNCSPHAIITTNYDQLLENIFPDYQTIVGERVIKTNLNLVGEIFKIHGCVSEFESLVITGSDYENYRNKKKYISAKLLTYMTEHPVFIFGYGMNDPNVATIIEDVAEILGTNGKIENMFYVQFIRSVADRDVFAEEKTIEFSGGSLRINCIATNDFGWILNSINQERNLKPINTKILRALAARTYKLVRSDIPRHKVEVNYQNLETVLEADHEFSNLLGMVPSLNSNMTHPFTLSQIGKRLGYPSWHKARQLIERVYSEMGINITETDNNYHCCVKTGAISQTRKYSKEAIALLELVRDDKPYALSL